MRMSFKEGGHKNKIYLVAIVLILSIAITGCPKKDVNTKGADNQPTGKQAKAGFTNPELSVSTKWLKANLQDKGLKIIDVRAKEEYDLGHVKGAINIPIEMTVDKDNEINGMMAKKEQIEELMENNGITNESKIVIYGASGTPYPGRFFWVLKYYGHDDVSVLDGGLQQWQKDGGEVDTEAPEITKTEYEATENPDINTTFEEIKKIVEEKDENVVLVDTRPFNEWVTGHLPDAVRLDWVELFTKDNPPLLKTAEELQKIFDNQGITKDKDLVLY